MKLKFIFVVLIAVLVSGFSHSTEAVVSYGIEESPETGGQPGVTL